MIEIWTDRERGAVFLLLHTCTPYSCMCIAGLSYGPAPRHIYEVLRREDKVDDRERTKYILL